jgi:L-lactate dehydrogenase (cytochrome)
MTILRVPYKLILYIVIKDELETACQMIGRRCTTSPSSMYADYAAVKNLKDAHPGLLNTGEIDHLVYRGDSHPYARKIVRRSRL